MKLVKPTISIPQTHDKIRGFAAPLTIAPARDGGNVEADMSCIGNLVPKMNFWQRLKYLFTGKVPDELKKGKVDPPPISMGEITRIKEKAEADGEAGRYSASYTTFAGCDIKLVFVEGLSADACRDEIERAYMPSRIELINESREKHCHVIGEGQAISVRAAWSDENEKVMSTGDLICIQFDRDALKFTDEVEGSMHLLALAANEYGDLATFILPNIQFTSWSWGISIDDLVSEVYLTFEADEPMYWGRMARLTSTSDDS